MSLKIMIVDDDPANLRLVRSLAVPLDHTVITFEDQEKAEHRAEEQRFDVFFLGMRTPELEGLQLARKIRHSESNKDSTIVMLSASEDIASLRTAFGEGADFVLTKPVTGARIIPMLNAMDVPGWKDKRHSARLPLFVEVACQWGDQQASSRSMNISETGMLLHPAFNVEVGTEVWLDFKIGEVKATLHVRARVARVEDDRVGVGFIDLTPEDRNAIQLYVMGRLQKGIAPQRQVLRSIWMGNGFLK
jgi:CheY-like chemotaxis protein